MEKTYFEKTINKLFEETDEEKRKHVFYDENGNFRPLVGKKGVSTEKLEHIRNTYMAAQRLLFIAILGNDHLRKVFFGLTEKYGDDLMAIAQKLMDDLENGELETKEEIEKIKTMTPEEADQFHMKKLEETELLITLLMGAAQDKVQLQMELIKYYYKDKDDHRDLPPMKEVNKYYEENKLKVQKEREISERFYSR